MRKSKFCKEKLKIISISMLTFGIFFTGSSFAEDNPDNLDVKLSNEYLEWSELSNKEKNNSIMPSTYIEDASSDILARYEVKQTPKLVSSLLGKNRVALENNVSATSTQSRYSLVDDLDMRVEHQGLTSECWAFSLIKVMETNIAITRISNNDIKIYLNINLPFFIRDSIFFKIDVNESISSGFLSLELILSFILAVT